MSGRGVSKGSSKLFLHALFLGRLRMARPNPILYLLIQFLQCFYNGHHYYFETFPHPFSNSHSAPFLHTPTRETAHVPPLQLQFLPGQVSEELQGHKPLASLAVDAGWQWMQGCILEYLSIGFPG